MSTQVSITEVSNIQRRGGVEKCLLKCLLLKLGTSREEGVLRNVYSSVYY
jgi:hypothetical protein